MQSFLVFLNTWMTVLTLSFGRNQNEYKNATLNDTSSSPYPYYEEYFEEVNQWTFNCSGYVCEKSGLNIMQIEQLLNNFNEAIMKYAERNELSNTYRLHWSNEFANLAKDKVKKCLPSTYEGSQKKYVLYDNRSLFEPAYFSPTLKLRDVAVEVVAGHRRKDYSDVEVKNDLIFRTEMVAYYTKLFFSTDKDFSARTSSTLMGCGYIFGEMNATSFDHLVCVFGLIYFRNETFKPIHGKACSNCTYYEMINATATLKFTDKKPTWACDRRFPFLCTDLNRHSEEIKVEYSVFDCSYIRDGSTTTTTQINMNIGMTQIEFQWPCKLIFIPMLILILVFLSLCVFNTVTALMLKFGKK